jgi:hypothetical protein
VWALGRGDLGDDVPGARFAVVDLGPVGAIGKQAFGSSFRPPALAFDRRDLIDQADRFSDVVAIGSGH